MFELGTQASRNANGQIGTVMGCRKNPDRDLMVEIKWASGLQQWMPANLLTPLERTIYPPKNDGKPEYLKGLEERIADGRAELAKKWRATKAQKLADTMDGLSTKNRKHKRKNRTVNKANKHIKKFQKSQNSEFVTYTRFKKRQLDQRIDRDRE